MSNLFKSDKDGRILLIDPNSRSCECYGASRALFSFQDVLLAMHSPVGCLLGLLSCHSFAGSLPRFCTSDLSEPEVVFGGEQKLAACLKKADKIFKPKFTFLLSACVPELIGDDILSVVREVQPEVSGKIVPVPLAGFKGDDASGYRKIMKVILENFVRDGSVRDERGVNLVGVVSNELKAQADLQELKRLLQALGLKVKAVLLSGSSILSVEKASQASLNVVMSRVHGLEAAQWMKERLNIPFISPLPPYGIEGTSQWLREVAQCFGQEKKAEKLVKREEARIYTDMSPGSYHYMAIGGLPFVISANPLGAVGLTRFMAKELTLVPYGLCTTGGKLAEEMVEQMKGDLGPLELEPRILIDPCFHEIKSLFLDAISDFRKWGFGDGYPLFLGSSNEEVMIEQHYFQNPVKMGLPFVRASAPLYKGIEIYPSPYMGYRGALNFLQDLIAQTCKYVWPKTTWANPWYTGKFPGEEEALNSGNR